MKKVLMVLMVISILTMGSMACEPVKDVVIDPVTLLPVTDDGSIVTKNDEPKDPSILEFPSNPKISQTDTELEMEAKLKDVVWLQPGKVEIDSIFAGAQGEYTLRVHNPYDKTVKFSVYRKDANFVADGYTRLPKQFYSWVIIDKPVLEIPAKSVAETLVTIKIGLRDRVSGEKYETWIGVMDESQTGLIKTEICSRWLISTK